jgi:hypothetical protein
MLMNKIKNYEWGAEWDGDGRAGRDENNKTQKLSGKKQEQICVNEYELHDKKIAIQMSTNKMTRERYITRVIKQPSIKF